MDDYVKLKALEQEHDNAISLLHRVFDLLTEVNEHVRLRSLSEELEVVVNEINQYLDPDGDE